ncbi:uncharacterized protein SPPG_02907 [Spizellomyces punctatus DAOM BR117]|uniref:Chitin-binding type-2 domain-containing protein n=1 Tax=Spizellomyces punctatus (strain DAOM BR117) TaxID=645134 RepID=A0A0L0HMW5_SPIPD|nr:uncharacterized protein SPPG_02907 [Spizellomyces punctatus DAOM BR117]KND02442.1 hypothetical protein SPPG_02907 [Spizellomyces punctatus DAOM BR117]|eukprot:XP_016610481.1 hypothetical protein SPPG_02907 [Spizellomyces punctatus DAOM BR117]
MMPKFAAYSTLIFFLLAGANAHMRMANPPPRGSVDPPVGPPDYDLASPLGGERSFPCGGKPVGNSVMNIQAGSTIPVSIVGGAPHNGGHCQFALSTDGQNFVVIKDVIRECLANGASTFDVQIPSSFPSGKTIFAWAWINAVGNREYYMNCADVTIQGGGSGFTGPQLFVADLPGTPTIPEMVPGDLNDGRQFFSQRKQITVGPGNGGSSQPQQPEQSLPTQPPTQTQDTPRPSPSPFQRRPNPRPIYQKPSSRPSSSFASDDPCDGNSPDAPFMVCSGTGFYMCNPGQPIFKPAYMDCAPGTACQPFGKFIQCLQA